MLRGLLRAVCSLLCCWAWTGHYLSARKMSKRRDRSSHSLLYQLRLRFESSNLINIWEHSCAPTRANFHFVPRSRQPRQDLSWHEADVIGEGILMFKIA
jgi:hypothetical protein